MTKKRKVKPSVERPPGSGVRKKDKSTRTDPSGFEEFFADKTNLLLALGLLVASVLIYVKTMGFDFINIDDGGYVFENAMVQTGLSWQSFKWSFTTFSQANWHPLTWLSYLAETTIFGSKPGTYHVVNVLFHAANSALLYVVLKNLTGSTWRSAMVAALLAFHPAHVESVAWIAERKDVLSAFFWILTTYFYVRYAQLKHSGPSDDPLESKWRRRFYLLTILAMVLGVLAKPMIVTLPFTLLLLDYWPLERFNKFRVADISPLVVEKLPLFALSAASSIVTVIAQKAGGAVVSLEVLPFKTRALNALVAYAKYLVMMFYPVNLGLTYPYENRISGSHIAAAIILLTGITAFSILKIRDRKYLFVGWLWFIGTLIPVIGLVQVGAQALADRYTYIPFIGLGIMVVWFAFDLLKKVNRKVVAVAAGTVLIVLAGLTFRQIRFWQSSEDLFLHTIAVTGKNGFIEQNLCLLYLDQGRLEEAEAQCRKAIEDSPTYHTPYKLLGVISFKRNNVDEAGRNFARALQLRPDDLGAYSDFAVSQLVQGKLDEALEMTDRMRSLVPLDPVTRQAFFQNYNLLGLSYSEKNEYAKSAACFGKALELNESDTDLRSNLGLMLYKAGEPEEGIRQVEESIRQNPNKAEPYNMLGTILSDQGKREEAIKQFERAIELKPDFAAARNNLQRVRSKK